MSIPSERSIQFELNGQRVSLHTDGQRRLLWILRTDFALTGTKYGCGQGSCGACTVIINGEAVRSCLTPLKDIAGKQVLTIEGLARNGKLHPLQQAFIDHGAFQCGFCTSGMILSAEALLHATPRPSRDAIVAHLERNLCRCGAHQRILAAVQSASDQSGGRS
jgi:aerobic-type carbon monoxide dehydrogenase small subunit (CoxS/CutS family)